MTTAQRNRLQDRLRIASPCPASWADMVGDDRSRHCTRCDRTVYDLERLEADELVALIQRTEGRLCGRLYARPDGRVMSRDCGEPVARPRRARTAVALVAGAASLAAAGAGLLPIAPRPMVMGPPALPPEDAPRMLGRVAKPPVDLVEIELGEVELVEDRTAEDE